MFPLDELGLQPPRHFGLMGRCHSVLIPLTDTGYASGDVIHYLIPPHQWPIVIEGVEYTITEIPNPGGTQPRIKIGHKVLVDGSLATDADSVCDVEIPATAVVGTPKRIDLGDFASTLKNTRSPILYRDRPIVPAGSLIYATIVANGTSGNNGYVFGRLFFHSLEE
jgi:hypothetical protein